MNVAMVMMAPMTMVVAVIMTIFVMTGICGGTSLTGRMFVRVSVHRRDPYSTRSGWPRRSLLASLVDILTRNCCDFIDGTASDCHHQSRRAVFPV
jgi:hypothetical protein